MTRSFPPPLSPPPWGACVARLRGPGTTFHFTVSCIGEVQGALRESPPSLMSRPLDIPSVEEEEWNMGEILDKVFEAQRSLITPRNVPQQHQPKEK